MALFAIMSYQPRPALRAALEREYAGKFQIINDKAYMLIDTGTTKSVFAKLGMENSANSEFSGIMIFRVTADFFGRSSTEFWEWVARAIEASDG